jgi:hypothetical protein
MFLVMHVHGASWFHGNLYVFYQVIDLLNVKKANLYLFLHKQTQYIFNKIHIIMD